MSQERYRLLLGTAGLLLLAAACAVLAWGFLAPLPTDAVATDKPTKAPPAKAATAAIPPINDFQGLWKKRLRRELQDVPAVPVATTASPIRKPAATLGIKLLGTILETGRTLAVFQAPAGRTEIRREGELIGEPSLGVEVLKIEPDRVEIKYQGEILSLELKPKES